MQRRSGELPMEQEVIFKEAWIPAHRPFTFLEQVDPTTGKKRYLMRGLILPFGKISRNNVLYNKDSILEKYKELIGRPVMYNHKIDDHSLPIGHFTNSTVRDDGWYYEADIDPQEKEVIRKLERQDLRHVSIQLIGSKVIERQDDKGNLYTEAHVGDVIEGSIVPAPGFLDTTASFAESLNTSNGKGAIAPAKMLDNEKEGIDSDVMTFLKDNPNPDDSVLHNWAKEKGYEVDEVEEAIYKIATAHVNMSEAVTPSDLKHGEDPDSDFDEKELNKGIKVEMEHTDSEEIAKAIAKAHLAEIPDYYTRLKKMEDDAMKAKAESMIEELGEDAVKEMLEKP